ncbi:MAG: uroporphyrinogen decarboxylase [Actinomycetota bacterium]|nr:uroporphyrinogen decarboxylase [Actinomycetota bacterium]
MHAGPSPFLDACRGRPSAHVPVWFMRQAGRSLPEYRELRGDRSILEAVRRPELAVEITLQPVRRYGVDAAILFSDIVVPLAATGVGVELVPGRGPVVADRFESRADLARLRPLDPEQDTGYVLDTVRALVSVLDVPLIGFAGAPFTVASYLVEGGPSRDLARTKALMHGDPSLFEALLERLADLALASLRSQVLAGASAVQLFDSWAGALTRHDYERFVLPASRRVLEGLADLDAPRIHFGVGTGELLDLMARAGADVVGVDWRVPLGSARERVGPGVSLQGNLDPAVCLAGAGPAEAEARRVLAEAEGRPGYVFNLGHGVLPGTDPDVLARIVELVHDEGRTDAPPGRGDPREHREP